MTAPEIVPHLTDNPLFDASKRFSAVPSFMEEPEFKPVIRRGSLSLSAKDYEGIWRAVQEDASRSSGESKSPLEDFKEFRQKLALLKQDMAGPNGSVPGSARSERNISPSRGSSPLKRLANRKAGGASGANSQQVPPAVQRIAASMRAEGLFQLPKLASISPAPLSDSSNSTTPVLLGSQKRTFHAPSYRVDKFRQKANAEFLRTEGTSRAEMILEAEDVPEVPVSREVSNEQASTDQESTSVEKCDSTRSDENETQSNAAKENKENACSGEQPRRWGSASSAASDRESAAAAAIRKLVVACGASKGLPIPTQGGEGKKPSKDWKVRCLSIPRPVCYSISIVD